MKRIPLFQSLLLAGGLSLAATALAQSSADASANPPGTTSNTTPPSGPLDPTPPPVSPLPSDPNPYRDANGIDRSTTRSSTSGSMSGAGTTRSNSTSSTGVSSSTSVNSGATINPGLTSSNSSINRQFTALDADRDSRLSLSEFLAGSVAAAPGSPMSDDRGVGLGSSTRSSNTTSTTSGRTGSSTGASTTTPGRGVSTSTTTTTSAQFTAQQFQMLDTNHDGYLSHSEVRANPGVAPSSRP